jgi:hypothetical protein
MMADSKAVAPPDDAQSFEELEHTFGRTVQI